MGGIYKTDLFPQRQNYYGVNPLIEYEKNTLVVIIGQYLYLHILFSLTKGQKLSTTTTQTFKALPNDLEK